MSFTVMTEIAAFFSSGLNDKLKSKGGITNSCPSPKQFLRMHLQLLISALYEALWQWVWYRAEQSNLYSLNGDGEWIEVALLHSPDDLRRFTWFPHIQGVDWRVAATVRCYWVQIQRLLSLKTYTIERTYFFFFLDSRTVWASWKIL